MIITQGPDPVIVAKSEGTDLLVKKFDVPKVSDDEKVDTNGAGDAFVGGFLGTLVSKLTSDEKHRIVISNELIEESILSGIDCATKMIKVIGCDLVAFK